MVGCQANGVIIGYTIQWGLKPDKGKTFLPEESRHFDPTETQVRQLFKLFTPGVLTLKYGRTPLLKSRGSRKNPLRLQTP